MGRTQTEVVGMSGTVDSVSHAVARAIPHLKWRHHGIGVLQAYLREVEVGVESRVHIWHDELVIPGMEESGQIHDHRFDLESMILYGTMEHTEFMLTEDPDGPWQKYTVQNARQFQSMDKRSALIGKPEQMTGAFRAELVTFKIPAGSRYLFPKRAFHRSTTKGLVVSLITKRNQESDPAVLLVPRPYSAEPTHGFANSWSEDRFVPFLRDAVDCLLS